MTAIAGDLARAQRLEDIVARLNHFQRNDEKPLEAVAAVSEFSQRRYVRGYTAEVKRSKQLQDGFLISRIERRDRQPVAAREDAQVGKRFIFA